MEFQNPKCYRELIGVPLDQIEVGRLIDIAHVIARLDPRNFELAVASAKASFDSAQDEFERSEKLAAQNAISESALAQLRSKRDVAEAQLDSARKTLADAAIVAPFAGTIASVPVREQQPVELGVDVAVVREDSDALAGRVRPLRGGVQKALGEDQQRARRAGVGLHQRPRRLDVEAVGLFELRPGYRSGLSDKCGGEGRMQGRCLCTHL